MGFAGVDVAVAIFVERFEDLRGLVDFRFGKFAVTIGIEQGEQRASRRRTMSGRRTWWRFFVLGVDGHRHGGDESCGESSGFHRGSTGDCDGFNRTCVKR